MKKILATVLCLAMLLTLAACSESGNKEEKPTDVSDTTAATETTEAPSGESDTTEAPSDAGEEHDHNHINYRGRTEYFNEEDLEEIEGRAWDFIYEQGEYNIYIYNGLEVDGMQFTQMQFTFDGTTARASGTYTSLGVKEDETAMTSEEMLKETDEMLASYEKVLTELYGEGSVGEQHGNTYTSWSDHTGNYIIMTRINESTVQVAFYIGTAAE